MTKDGSIYRRFRTLYRQPDPIDWRKHDLVANVALPVELGVRPEVAASYSNEVADFVKWQMVESFSESDYPAMLFAGLNKMAIDTSKGDFYGTPSNGLSDKTFHHAGASRPNLIMDPENDLIIAMTRNSGGKKYETYHQQFIDAVIVALEK